MRTAKAEILEIVNRETRAWDTQNVQLLISVFHPDMVWPWPESVDAHDPMDWVFVMGRFNRERWMQSWQDLFDSHRLIHNHRKIKKIEISKEADGAFAVVDIDTLWVHKDGSSNHWEGRVCKVYAKVGHVWKMTMHTGALLY